uniref:Uncharacterized protein n=1 Tax=Haptolina brevifila TaxID=156173 RepID=A0A7S2ND47_9EUKA
MVLAKSPPVTDERKRERYTSSRPNHRWTADDARSHSATAALLEREYYEVITKTPVFAGHIPRVPHWSPQSPRPATHAPGIPGGQSAGGRWEGDSTFVYEDTFGPAGVDYTNVSSASANKMFWTGRPAPQSHAARVAKLAAELGAA